MQAEKLARAAMDNDEVQESLDERSIK